MGKACLLPAGLPHTAFESTLKRRILAEFRIGETPGTVYAGWLWNEVRGFCEPHSPFPLGFHGQAAIAFLLLHACCVL